MAEADSAVLDREQAGVLALLERSRVAPPVRVITRIARVSAVAARTSARLAASDRLRACARRRSPGSRRRGPGAGSGSTPCSCSPLRRRGRSSRASGLPPVAATSSSATSGEMRTFASWSSRTRRPSRRILRARARESPAYESPATSCEEHDDTFRLEPPRGEGEGAGGGLVEPVRVVDHAEKRAVVSGGGEEAQGRGADEQPAGTLRFGKRERTAQRVRLHRRQRPRAGRGRGRTSSCRPEYANSDSVSTPSARTTRASPARSHGVLEQRALADPRLAADDKRAAPAAPRFLEHSIVPSALALTADQHASIIERDDCHQVDALGKSRTRSPATRSYARLESHTRKVTRCRTSP